VTMRTAVRAVVHVHSEWSYDGSWTLDAIARTFRRLRYDAVLMAEHDRGFDDARWRSYCEACARASTDDLLLVPGMEHADETDGVHIAVWGASDFLGEGLDPLDLLDRATSAAATSVFAHPIRRDAVRAYTPEWTEHLTGIELWNRKYDGYAPGAVPAELLRANPGLVPFVTLDFHTAHQLYPLAMRLWVEGTPSPASVFAALRAKRCRPEVFGLSALRFTHGRGLDAARLTDRIRRRVARAIR
jgi:hypothetical protein